MDNFEISKQIEKASKNIFSFRKDEIKYLKSNLNKFYKNVFNNKNPKIEDVEKYIYSFFDKIQNADFPLGHKYINLDLEKNKYNKKEFNEEEIDFFYICNEFFNSLILYKKSKEKEEENYV